MICPTVVQTQIIANAKNVSNINVIRSMFLYSIPFPIVQYNSFCISGKIYLEIWNILLTEAIQYIIFDFINCLIKYWRKVAQFPDKYKCLDGVLNSPQPDTKLWVVSPPTHNVNPRDRLQCTY